MVVNDQRATKAMNIVDKADIKRLCRVSGLRPITHPPVGEFK